MSIELIVFLAVFVILFLLNFPIWASLLVSSSSYLLVAGEQLGLIARRCVAGMDSFLLLAIPMFVLAAELMNQCGITTYLFRFANNLVGWIPGGLAHANVVASMLFAGMSGSSAADAAGLGTMEIKAMTDEGFDKPFSAAITAASSCIGPIIPPSIPMVLYSSLAGASIGKLFIGGIIPGILMGLTMMLICFVISKKRNYPRVSGITFRIIGKSFIEAIPGIMVPVILLGGIYSGIFTPTEAAAVAAVYSLLIGVFLYKRIKIKDLIRILRTTVINSSLIVMIIGAAALFGYILTIEQIPAKLTSGLLSLTTNKYMMMFIFNLILLVLGCFMELNSILLIFIPIMVPVVKLVGIDLVHFGVVAVVNLMIGTVTPPFGMMMYITAGIAREPVHIVIKELIPFYIGLIVLLLVLSYCPVLVTALPSLM
jgi:tripartite ATP-independent transporter DctM subunit